MPTVEKPTATRAFTGPGWRLVVGDVLKPVKPPVAPGGRVDLAVADPPYNYGIDYGDGRRADTLDPAAYYEWTKRWLSAMCSRLRPGGAMFVICPDEWAAETAFIARWRLNLEMRNWIKWSETFGPHQEGKFSRCSRHVLYFVKPGSRITFTPDRVPSDRLTKYKDKRANPDGKVPSDVWEFSRVCGTFRERVGGIIPTQIPEDLLARIVRAASRPGDRVLEFFAGSGSLGRVCVREGREYEGWESNPRTAQVAAKRIAEIIPPKTAKRD